MIKLILAALILVAAAACSQSTGGTAAPATGAVPPPESASAAAAPASGTAVKVKDFQIDPGTVTAKGGTVAFAVTNDGPTVHNVKVRDSSGKIVFGTRDLREGESENLSGELQPGSYDLICTLPGHESLGVKAKLTITAP